mmetsp:Transcript_4985/g.12251  ORF Transcript_4985/g.12251 Transcript_4985/m.12251 type:complete len:287 (+) Transcript_4985:2922-3782(+)
MARVGQRPGRSRAVGGGEGWRSTCDARRQRLKHVSSRAADDAQGPREVGEAGVVEAVQLGEGHCSNRLKHRLVVVAQARAAPGQLPQALRLKGRQAVVRLTRHRCHQGRMVHAQGGARPQHGRHVLGAHARCAHSGLVGDGRQQRLVTVAQRGQAPGQVAQRLHVKHVQRGAKLRRDGGEQGGVIVAQLPQRPHDVGDALRQEVVQLGARLAQQHTQQARVVRVRAAQRPDDVGQLLLLEQRRQAGGARAQHGRGGGVKVLQGRKRPHHVGQLLGLEVVHQRADPV